MHRFVLTAIAVTMAALAAVVQGRSSAPGVQATPQVRADAPVAPAPTAPSKVAPAAPRPVRSSVAPACAGHARGGLRCRRRTPRPSRRYCVTCHSERGKAGGLSLAGVRRRHAARRRCSGREDDSQAAHRHDAARRGEAPRGHWHRRHGRCVRDADRRRRRARPAARLAVVPASEPRRVCARHQGHLRARHRRLGHAAGRHHQPRVRQRRRRANVLARADGKLPARRQPGHGAGARRSAMRPPASRSTACRRRPRSSSASTARRSARAAACRSCTRSRPTASTCSVSSCTATRAVSCSAGRRQNEQVEISIDGERKAVLDIDPKMYEGSTSLDHEDAGRARERRAAPRHRGLHAALRGAGQRPHRAHRSHAGRHADRRGVRHHDAAAPEGPGDCRPAARDRHLRHRQPPRGLHVPADVEPRRARLRDRDRAPRVDARRSAGRCPTSSSPS